MLMSPAVEAERHEVIATVPVNINLIDLLKACVKLLLNVSFSSQTSHHLGKQGIPLDTSSRHSQQVHLPAVMPTQPLIISTFLYTSQIMSHGSQTP